MKDSSQIRMNIKTMDDIKKLEQIKSVKYVNVDILNPDLEVIYHLIDHGQNYSYAEQFADKNGYIYVSHDIFKQTMLFILDIINCIPVDLTELEIARYLYITIGKNLGYDINSLPDKNETFSLKNVNIINNIWGCISVTKGTNASFSKLYLFLCRLMNIDCDLVVTSKLGYQKNQLTIEKSNITVDITQDIPFIQAGFQTQNFPGYNDNLKLDQKIGYIKDDYSENKIEQALLNIDYSKPNIFKTILLKTSEIINANKLKPIELGMIYEIIFNKYCPHFNITINNLYIYNLNNIKEHFILITQAGKYYGYNYTRNSFVEIAKEEIIKNIESQKIGMYQNEIIPYITKKPEESY